jgi:hypothetical protein
VALEIGDDFAVIVCDRGGCQAHCAIRPVPGVAYSMVDLAAVVFDFAEDEGWYLSGSAYCPDHHPGTAPDWVRSLNRVHVPATLSTGRYGPS